MHRNKSYVKMNCMALFHGAINQNILMEKGLTLIKSLKPPLNTVNCFNISV